MGRRGVAYCPGDYTQDVSYDGNRNNFQTVDLFPFLCQSCKSIFSSNRHLKPEHLTSLYKESDARIEFSRARMATLKATIKAEEVELARKLVQITHY